MFQMAVDIKKFVFQIAWAPEAKTADEVCFSVIFKQFDYYFKISIIYYYIINPSFVFLYNIYPN